MPKTKRSRPGSLFFAASPEVRAALQRVAEHRTLPGMKPQIGRTLCELILNADRALPKPEPRIPVKATRMKIRQSHEFENNSE